MGWWWGGGFTERIQHEDDLQCCLSHAKCGQRGVPNTSVLEEGRQKSGFFNVIIHHSYTNTSQMKKENGKRQHCRQSHTHVITEILQSEYTVHEEFPHLKKTESNWRSDEWNEMKEALFKSLSIIQYVNRCSNKNATLLTVRRVHGLKARQKHKNNKTNTSANTLGVPPHPPPNP